MPGALADHVGALAAPNELGLAPGESPEVAAAKEAGCKGGLAEQERARASQDRVVHIEERGLNFGRAY